MLFAVAQVGQRSYVKLLRGRREEPGNEATLPLFGFYDILL